MGKAINHSTKSGFSLRLPPRAAMRFQTARPCVEITSRRSRRHVWRGSEDGSPCRGVSGTGWEKPCSALYCRISILDLPSALVMLASELPFALCALGVGNDETSTPAARRSAFRLKSLFPAALLPFCAGVPAIGVGHCAACAGRGVPPAPNAWFGPPFSASDARGVPHSIT